MRKVTMPFFPQPATFYFLIEVPFSFDATHNMSIYVIISKQDLVFFINEYQLYIYINS